MEIFMSANSVLRPSECTRTVAINCGTVLRILLVRLSQCNGSIPLSFRISPIDRSIDQSHSLVPSASETSRSGARTAHSTALPNPLRTRPPGFRPLHPAHARTTAKRVCFRRTGSHRTFRTNDRGSRCAPPEWLKAEESQPPPPMPAGVVVSFSGNETMLFAIRTIAITIDSAVAGSLPMPHGCE